MAGGGGIGQNLGNSMMRMGSRLGGSLPSQGPTIPSYVPPSALSQGPSTGGPGIGPVNHLASQPAPQQMSPLTQQIMQRQLPPPPMVGLPAALMQMQGRLNQPMMRGPMPVYQNPALAFRPNMAPAQEALNRVRPSVYKTDLDAARARVAELEAQQQQGQSIYDYGGGGGGG